MQTVASTYNILYNYIIYYIYVYNVLYIIKKFVTKYDSEIKSNLKCNCHQSDVGLLAAVSIADMMMEGIEVFNLKWSLLPRFCHF